MEDWSDGELSSISSSSSALPASPRRSRPFGSFITRSKKTIRIDHDDVKFNSDESSSLVDLFGEHGVEQSFEKEEEEEGKVVSCDWKTCQYCCAPNVKQATVCGVCLGCLKDSKRMERVELSLPEMEEDNEEYSGYDDEFDSMVIWGCERLFDLFRLNCLKRYFCKWSNNNNNNNTSLVEDQDAHRLLIICFNTWKYNLYVQSIISKLFNISNLHYLKYGFNRFRDNSKYNGGILLGNFINRCHFVLEQRNVRRRLVTFRKLYFKLILQPNAAKYLSSKCNQMKLLSAFRKWKLNFNGELKILKLAKHVRKRVLICKFNSWKTNTVKIRSLHHIIKVYYKRNLLKLALNKWEQHVKIKNKLWRILTLLKNGKVKYCIENLKWNVQIVRKCKIIGVLFARKLKESYFKHWICEYQKHKRFNRIVILIYKKNVLRNTVNQWKSETLQYKSSVQMINSCKLRTMGYLFQDWKRMMKSKRVLKKLNQNCERFILRNTLNSLRKIALKNTKCKKMVAIWLKMKRKRVVLKWKSFLKTKSTLGLALRNWNKQNLKIILCKWKLNLRQQKYAQYLVENIRKLKVSCGFNRWKQIHKLRKTFSSLFQKINRNYLHRGFHHFKRTTMEQYCFHRALKIGRRIKLVDAFYLWKRIDKATRKLWRMNLVFATQHKKIAMQNLKTNIKKNKILNKVIKRCLVRNQLIYALLKWKKQTDWRFKYLELKHRALKTNLGNNYFHSWKRFTFTSKRLKRFEKSCLRFEKKSCFIKWNRDCKRLKVLKRLMKKKIAHVFGHWKIYNIFQKQQEVFLFKLCNIKFKFHLIVRKRKYFNDWHRYYLSKKIKQIKFRIVLENKRKNTVKMAYSKWYRFAINGKVGCQFISMREQLYYVQNLFHTLQKKRVVFNKMKQHVQVRKSIKRDCIMNWSRFTYFSKNKRLALMILSRFAYPLGREMKRKGFIRWKRKLYATNMKLKRGKRKIFNLLRKNCRSSKINRFKQVIYFQRWKRLVIKIKKIKQKVFINWKMLLHQRFTFKIAFNFRHVVDTCLRFAKRKAFNKWKWRSQYLLFQNRKRFGMILKFFSAWKIASCGILRILSLQNINHLKITFQKWVVRTNFSRKTNDKLLARCFYHWKENRSKTKKTILRFHMKNCIRMWKANQKRKTLYCFEKWKSYCERRYLLVERCVNQMRKFSLKAAFEILKRNRLLCNVLLRWKQHKLYTSLQKWKMFSRRSRKVITKVLNIWRKYILRKGFHCFMARVNQYSKAKYAALICKQTVMKWNKINIRKGFVCLKRNYLQIKLLSKSIKKWKLGPAFRHWKANLFTISRKRLRNVLVQWQKSLLRNGFQAFMNNNFVQHEMVRVLKHWKKCRLRCAFLHFKKQIKIVFTLKKSFFLWQKYILRSSFQNFRKKVDEISKLNTTIQIWEKRSLFNGFKKWVSFVSSDKKLYRAVRLWKKVLLRKGFYSFRMACKENAARLGVLSTWTKFHRRSRLRNGFFQFRMFCSRAKTITKMSFKFAKVKKRVAFQTFRVKTMHVGKQHHALCFLMKRWKKFKLLFGFRQMKFQWKKWKVVQIKLTNLLELFQTRKLKLCFQKLWYNKLVKNASMNLQTYQLQTYFEKLRCYQDESKLFWEKIGNVWGTFMVRKCFVQLEKHSREQKLFLKYITIWSRKKLRVAFQTFRKAVFDRYLLNKTIRFWRRRKVEQAFRVLVSSCNSTKRLKKCLTIWRKHNLSIGFKTFVSRCKSKSNLYKVCQKWIKCKQHHAFQCLRRNFEETLLGQNYEFMKMKAENRLFKLIKLEIIFKKFCLSKVIRKLKVFATQQKVLEKICKRKTKMIKKQAFDRMTKWNRFETLNLIKHRKLENTIQKKTRQRISALFVQWKRYTKRKRYLLIKLVDMNSRRNKLLAFSTWVRKINYTRFCFRDRLNIKLLVERLTKANVFQFWKASIDNRRTVLSRALYHFNSSRVNVLTKYLHRWKNNSLKLKLGVVSLSDRFYTNFLLHDYRKELCFNFWKSKVVSKKFKLERCLNIVEINRQQVLKFGFKRLYHKTHPLLLRKAFSNLQVASTKQKYRKLLANLLFYLQDEHERYMQMYCLKQWQANMLERELAGFRKNRLKSLASIRQVRESARKELLELQIARKSTQYSTTRENSFFNFN